MKDMVSMIMDQFGDDTLENLGQQSGLNKDQAKTALQGAIPVLLGAMAKNTSDKGGAEALAGALDRDHDGGILDNLGGFLSNAKDGPGAGILKHVLGGQQETVESGLSQKMGISSSSMSSILQMAAPIILGMLGKEKKERGLDSGGLSSLINMASSMTGSNQGGLDVGDLIGMFTGGQTQQQSKGGGLIGMLGGLFGKK